MTVTTKPAESEHSPEPQPEPEIVELAGPQTERSPVYVLSGLCALALLALSLLISLVDRDALVGLEADVLHLFYELPNPLERFFIGLSQFVAVLYPIILVGAFLVARRARGILVGALGAAISGLGIWALESVVDHEHPGVLEAARNADAWIIDAGFPDQVYTAIAAALAVISGAYMGRRLRHFAWTTVVVVVLLRVASGTEVPVDLMMAIAIGWAGGSLALLALTSPTHRPTGSDIAAALMQSGYAVRRLVPASVDARGSTPWFATTTDGSRLFVKVLGRDERDADLMFRLYRYVRLKNVGDERPFSSLRRTVEHEALVSLKARDVGVRTPHMLTVATVADNGMLLAYEMIEGASVDDLEPTAWTDELLRGIWEQVAILRKQRIAHRDLRQANVFVDADGRPWIIDFGFSELAVSDRMLDHDAAQLIAATSIAVGAHRAVSAAVDVLGKDAVGRSLAYLQLPALAGATRHALSKDKQLLAAIQQEIKDQTGVEDVKYEPVNRVTIRTALMLVCSLVALYVLIPQFADVTGMFRQLEDANWWLVAAVLACSFVTYCGAGISLVAACPVPIAYTNALETALAGSFVNRITPAGIGGIGLNVRFMQKAGANTTEAASRWGVNAIVGAIVHMTLATLFLVWAGSDNAFDFRLPKVPIISAIAVICVGAGVVFLVPYGRRKLLGPVERIARHAWEGVTSVAKSPGRLGLMFVGGAHVVLGYLFALYFAVKAFGGTTSLAAVGAVYLAGSAIGQAAPTPGGLGAVEAVLIAGLVGVGLDKEIAVPAVLLFRFATFWIPVLPGWWSFSHLSKTARI